MGEKLIFANKGEAFTSSLILAKGLEIEPRSVRSLIEQHITDLEAFGKVCISNAPLETNGGRQKTKIYILNEQQATFVISLMKNTPRVVKFKKLLVKQFFEMREFLQSLAAVNKEYGELSDAVQRFYGDTKPYHFSNEIDMLNRIIFGKTAKEMREVMGLKKGESIRPHLTLEQIQQLDKMQRADEYLLSMNIDYQRRKERLIEYFNSICNNQENSA